MKFYVLRYSFVDTYQSGKVEKYFKTYKKLKTELEKIKEEDVSILNLSVNTCEFEEDKEKK